MELYKEAQIVKREYKETCKKLRAEGLRPDSYQEVCNYGVFASDVWGLSLPEPYELADRVPPNHPFRPVNTKSSQKHLILINIGPVSVGSMLIPLMRLLS